VFVVDLADLRSDTDGIGYQKSPYGGKGAPIRTVKPVSHIVREALMADLVRNGHQVVAVRKESDVVISGAISKFWLDLQVRFWSTEFIGTVAVNLTVVNTKTDEVIDAHGYQSIYSEKVSARNVKSQSERVMNVALARLVREISTDSRVIRALRSL
jgi:hypothetical protein